MAATAKAASKKAKTAKTTKERAPTSDTEPDSFVVSYFNRPVLEVRWLSDLVFNHVGSVVNGWLDLADEIVRDDLNDLVTDCIAKGCIAEQVDEEINSYLAKLDSCPYHTQTPADARAFLRSELPQAISDLLHVLVHAAGDYVTIDPDEKCLFHNHRNLHLEEGRTSLKELDAMQRSQLRQRMQARRQGGKVRIVKSDRQITQLAREYENLQNSKSYGDTRDRSLWEAICARYEAGDPKWREHARVDDSDVPEVQVKAFEFLEVFLGWIA